MEVLTIVFLSCGKKLEGVPRAVALVRELLSQGRAPAGDVFTLLIEKLLTSGDLDTAVAIKE